MKKYDYKWLSYRVVAMMIGGSVLCLSGCSSLKLNPSSQTEKVTVRIK